MLCTSPQAVFHTTRGRYPLSVEEFHNQAGSQAAIKSLEGASKDADHAIRSECNIFYPPHMRINKGGLKVGKLFKKSPGESKSLSDELLTSYHKALKRCQDSHQLKILYLQFCWHKPYYAAVFFKGVVERANQFLKLLSTGEKQVVVAINTECLHLMSASSPSVSMCGYNH